MNPPRSAPALFHTTQWSMVLAAAEDSDAALERLCRTYWRPLYGYARRTGKSAEDAEDMVQGFLAKTLEKQWLAGVKREAGPFRRFLQMAFKCYLCDQFDRAQTQKRGGRTTAIPLDAPEAEAFYHRELATTETPETAYERAWALEVFARARAVLRRECIDSGREELYDALQSGDSQAAISERTGTTVSAVNSFAFRVRRRLQELIRAEILQTVGNPDDLEDEVRSLLRALGGN
jgi:DNA-directed RNA polymerase specialized sigma24 family protein